MYKAKISVIALLTLAVLATALAGCGRKGLISVKGEKVTKDEFYARLEKVPVQTPSGTKLAGQYVVEQIIGEKIIQQFAKDKGVAPTEAQIKKKLDYISKESGGNIQAIAAQQGTTVDAMKQKIAVEQSFINAVTKNVNVPDADVKKAYDSLLAAKNSPLKRPEQVMLRIIDVNTKAAVDKAYKDLTSGQEFAAVAGRVNNDPTARQRQGLIDWVAKGDPRIPPAVTSVLFSTTVGTYSKPFTVKNEWVIVKAERKRPELVRKFDDVKDMIKEQMAVQKGNQDKSFAKEIGEYTKNADIQVNNAQYKKVVDKIKKDAENALKLMATQGTKPVAMPGK